MVFRARLIREAAPEGFSYGKCNDPECELRFVVGDSAKKMHTQGKQRSVWPR